MKLIKIEDYMIQIKRVQFEYLLSQQQIQVRLDRQKDKHKLVLERLSEELKVVKQGIEMIKLKRLQTNFQQ
ncbi:unnamed protein product [Paramecium sonneborni]|uniref:Uncharacterized protein n=1 Tax=Paramecium sonneborni TaxID=65129 RepID=A0A8S1PTA3_9CILI|nr:unnamed protein product [Paramecium sonneborni]